MSELKDLIRDYLSSINIMQLATSADDRPWCCNLHYAVDDELNLYWTSLPESRHSVEIAQNDLVAGVVFAPIDTEADYLKGLQFEGRAKMLTGEEEEAGIRLYKDQLRRKDISLEDMRSGKNPHKLYMVKPSKYILFDNLNFPEAPKQEYEGK